MGKVTLLRIALFVTSIQLFITGCKKDDPTVVQAGQVSNYDANVALAWNQIFLEVERYTPGYRPPIAGRATGYIGMAAYESTVSGMSDGYQSLAPQFPGLVIPAIEKGKEYHWPIVLNACYARSLRLFFPTVPATQAKLIKTLEDELNNNLIKKMPLDVFNRSAEYGKKVADAVYTYSATDVVGHERYLNPTDKNYPDGTKPGEWARTFPDFGNPLLPDWGKCRSMAITKSEMLIAAPVPYSESPTSEFYKQAKETQDAVNKIKAGKDYTGKWIADFWSDDCAGLTMTPAGRWISITNQVIALKKTDLQTAVVAYAKVGMSLCDAGIACWDQKFYWKVERPQSYIRRVIGEKDWNSIMCVSEGIGKTPPFPAYPSGHSTFGAAAAEILTSMFGNNFAMSDKSHILRSDFIGKPRFFKNFYEMADENGFSRIPIGVHYRMDYTEGLTLGYKVGKKINALPWKK
jgi:hypothetical protein